jgi:predicted ester cyclase
MRGLEGARQLVALFHTSFLDVRVNFEDFVCEGEKVALLFTYSRTNKGGFMGMPATGKKVKVAGTGIFRVVNGKLTDNWVNFDALGLMQQLGVVPLPGTAGS